MNEEIQLQFYKIDQMSLKNNWLKFKTLGQMPIILEESKEHTLSQNFFMEKHNM